MTYIKFRQKVSFVTHIWFKDICIKTCFYYSIDYVLLCTLLRKLSNQSCAIHVMNN